MGAHEGIGSAVVFRTRPVMKFHLTISSKYEILTETGITFYVTPCVSYNGFNILDETGALVFFMVLLMRIIVIIDKYLCCCCY